MTYNRNINRRRGKSNFTSILVVLALLAIPAIGVGGCQLYKSTEQIVTATVTDKERVNGRESSTYLIFTDAETFAVEDTLIYGRFNSSDTYGRIKEGKTYKFKVVGWRIGFTSSYRNIIEATEVR